MTLSLFTACAAICIPASTLNHSIYNDFRLKHITGVMTAAHDKQGQNRLRILTTSTDTCLHLGNQDQFLLQGSHLQQLSESPLALRSCWVVISTKQQHHVTPQSPPDFGPYQGSRSKQDADSQRLPVMLHSYSNIKHRKLFPQATCRAATICIPLGL